MPVASDFTGTPTIRAGILIPQHTGTSFHGSLVSTPLSKSQIHSEIVGNNLFGSGTLNAIKTSEMLMHQHTGNSFNGSNSKVSDFSVKPGSVLIPQHTGNSHNGSITQTPFSSLTDRVQGGTQESDLAISNQDKERFTKFFESCNPVGGLVSGMFLILILGHQAKELFLKSGLALEILGQIWHLVSAGAASIPLPMFLVAMVIITKLKIGAIATVPVTIPQSFLASIISNHQHDAISDIFSDATAKSNYNTNIMDMERDSTSKPSLENQKIYEGYFKSLDTTHKGYLSGNNALIVGAESYQFFLKSNLPEGELGQIWYHPFYCRDIVDSKKSGTISIGGFVAAMHLIKNRLDTINVSQNTAEQREILLGSPIISPDALPSSITAVSDSSMLGTQNVKVPLISASNPLLSLSKMSSNSVPSIFSLPISTSSHAATSSLRTQNTEGLQSVPRINLQSRELGAKPLELGSNIQNSIEINSISELQFDLNTRKEDVRALKEQLFKLNPSTEDLFEKRHTVEAELKLLTDSRIKLTIELSQKRAMYEAELATISEMQAMIPREKKTVDDVMIELERFQISHAELGSQKVNLSQLQSQANSQLSVVKKEISQVTEETNELRTSIEQIRAEHSKQKQLLNVNQTVLQQAQAIFNQTKAELEEEQGKLKLAVQKTAILQQQADVQNEITRKEKKNQLLVAEQLKREETRQAIHVVDGEKTSVDIPSGAVFESKRKDSGDSDNSFINSGSSSRIQTVPEIYDISSLDMMQEMNKTFDSSTLYNTLTESTSKLNSIKIPEENGNPKLVISPKEDVNFKLEGVKDKIDFAFEAAELGFDSDPFGSDFQNAFISKDVDELPQVKQITGMGFSKGNTIA